MKGFSMDISLIKKFEGFRSNAYLCPAGKWTIGYGTTYLSSKSRPVESGDTITERDAEEELKNFLNKQVMPKINSLVEEFGPIPQKIIDSLCSLAYNVGPGCLSSLKLRIALNNKSISGLYTWLMSFNLVNGHVNQGLVNRRTAESNNFKDVVWK